MAAEPGKTAAVTVKLNDMVDRYCSEEDYTATNAKKDDDKSQVFKNGSVAMNN